MVNPDLRRLLPAHEHTAGQYVSPSPILFLALPVVHSLPLRRRKPEWQPSRGRAWRPPGSSGARRVGRRRQDRAWDTEIGSGREALAYIRPILLYWIQLQHVSWIIGPIGNSGRIVSYFWHCASIYQRYGVSDLSIYGRILEGESPEDVELQFLFMFLDDDFGTRGSKLARLENDVSATLHRKASVASRRGVQPSTPIPWREQILSMSRGDRLTLRRQRP